MHAGLDSGIQPRTLTLRELDEIAPSWRVPGQPRAASAAAPATPDKTDKPRSAPAEKTPATKSVTRLSLASAQPLLRLTRRTCSAAAPAAAPSAASPRTTTRTTSAAPKEVACRGAASPAEGNSLSDQLCCICLEHFAAGAPLSFHARPRRAPSPKGHRQHMSDCTRVACIFCRQTGLEQRIRHAHPS